MSKDDFQFKIIEEDREQCGRDFKNSIIRAIVASLLLPVFRARYFILALVTGVFAWFLAIHGLAWKNCFGAALAIIGIGVLIQSVRRFYLDTMDSGLGTPLESTILDNRIFGCISLGVGAYLLW